MTVTTVFATAPGGNGSGASSSSTYATARSTFNAATGLHVVGQDFNLPTYICWESALIFLTSGITDTDEVSGVVLSMDGAADASATDLNVIAASSAYDGGQFVSGDWIAGDSLTGQTTYATWNSSGYSASYNAFTSAGAAFNSAINKTGNTALMLYSDRHAAGNTPTGDERVSFNDADAGGTGSDPKLDITHAPPPTAALTGTITASVTETDIVNGGKTLIITLTNDTWIAAGAGSFDLQRDEIIAGCDSAQSEATGWDLVPKLSQSLGGVVRTSDTVVTITWDAFATYNITAQETITVTVPGTAVTGGSPIVATPTFTIDVAGATVVKDIISFGLIVFPR